MAAINGVNSLPSFSIDPFSLYVDGTPRELCLSIVVQYTCIHVHMYMQN